MNTISSLPLSKLLASIIHLILSLNVLKLNISQKLTVFSIDKIPRVVSPVLVIHGTEDEVIDFSHGLAIYERCPRAVEPLWVEVKLSSWQTED